MKYTILIIALLSVFFHFVSCEQKSTSEAENLTYSMENFEQEKSAILAILNEETAAAFNRDYEAWKSKWIHQSYVTKTYMDFTNNSITETLGWEEINAFVKTYIEEHPEPSPLPSMVDDIDVRLYGSGAWVSYEQMDAERGLKRETRLMEKENGQWKIAGMHTTIYGFEEKKEE